MTRSIRRTSSAVCLLLFALVACQLHGLEKAEKMQLFNGKDLSGWLAKGGEADETLKVGTAQLNLNNPQELVVVAGDGELINFKEGARDFHTEAKLGDGVYEVEFMVPKDSNSGVYLQGEYEVQILDSFGKETVGPGDLGGLYAAQAPRLNASKAPGQWQSFVIDFRAPKFDDSGKKVANARFVKVVLNGQVIHEDVEMKSQTPGGLTGQEHPVGPLMFQGNHGPVAFRNISFTATE